MLNKNTFRVQHDAIRNVVVMLKGYESYSKLLNNMMVYQWHVFLFN